MNGGDAKLDDMINTPRISEIEEEDEAGSVTGEEQITHENEAKEKITPENEATETRVTQCDVGVETQREMAKVWIMDGYKKTQVAFSSLCIRTQVPL